MSLRSIRQSHVLIGCKDREDLRALSHKQSQGPEAEGTLSTNRGRSNTYGTTGSRQPTEIGDRSKKLAEYQKKSCRADHIRMLNLKPI